MTVEVIPRRPAAPMAGRPARGLWLFLAVAVLSSLASLLAIGALATARSAKGLEPRLVGSATVVIPAFGLESADAGAARAVETLDRVAGVARARALDPVDTDAVVGQIVGHGRTGRDWAGARLVSVSFTPGAGVAAADLNTALRRDGLAAAVDDHGMWTGPVERAALLTAVRAAGGLLMVCAVIAAVTALAAWRRFLRARDRITLLRRLGATDSFASQLIRDPPALTAALAAAVGASTGAVCAAASSTLALPPFFAAVGPTDFGAAVAWFVVAAIIGATAAHLTAAAAVARVP